MRALILPIALLSLVGFAVSTACTATLSVGAPVTFTAYGSCDSASDYAIVTGDYADYCGPNLSCTGDYYALCNGTAWDSCACDIPSGYTVVISSPDWGDGYGGDLGDGGGGDTGSTPGDGSSTVDGNGDDGSSTGDGSTGSGDSGDAGSGDSGSGDDGGSGGG